MNVTFPFRGADAAPVQFFAASFPVKDPTGNDIRIPATAAEDEAYFTIDELTEIRRYYEENGYVVVRGLIPAGRCAAATAWFDREVKPSERFIYRQTTANPERHVFTAHGFVLNPILNVQSLDARWFCRFRSAGLAVVTHPNVQKTVRAILGEPGTLVQSMYFQGNPATWAHQDTYYLDAEEPGRMLGAWFAMEDIAPGAGRFFVYPGSHRIGLAKNGCDYDVAFHHDRYKKLAIETIRSHGLACRVPALQQGDVLFWSSKTLHGSLDTTQPQFSRSSFTGHYIPDSSRFVQFQTRIRPLSVERIAGMRVHKPKDLNRPLQRAIFWLETQFPKPFQTAKKIAIKALTR